MVTPVVLDGERRRFYDGGLPADDSGAGAEPADPSKDILVVLDRRLDAVNGREAFVLKRRIAYDDRRCGELIVPTALERVQDRPHVGPGTVCLAGSEDGRPSPGCVDPRCADLEPVGRRHRQYIATTGTVIDRVEADRIFRDGMADTGTGLVRRWLVWTAVTLATMLSAQGTSPSPLGRAYYRFIVVATLFSIAWLGYVSTADLFDRTDDWPLTYELSWMADRSFAAELMIGVAAAIVVPIVLGLLWGKFRTAGWIAGIGVALLLHVTLGVLAVTAIYIALEWLAAKLPAMLLARRRGRRRRDVRRSVDRRAARFARDRGAPTVAQWIALVSHRRRAAPEGRRRGCSRQLAQLCPSSHSSNVTSIPVPSSTGTMPRFSQISDSNTPHVTSTRSATNDGSAR